MGLAVEAVELELKLGARTMMAPYLRFEEIAERAKINSTTLRYYIRLGLLPAAKRNPAGHKEYPLSVMSRLAAISRAKGLGLTLAEIGQLYPNQGWPRCIADSKLEALNDQIAQLTQQRDALARLRDSCEGTETCALVSHIKDGETWDGSKASD